MSEHDKVEIRKLRKEIGRLTEKLKQKDEVPVPVSKKKKK